MSDELVTSKGKYRLFPVSETLVLKALAKIEKDYRDRGELLDTPKYTVTVAGGVTEELPHNETTLVVEGDEEQTKKNQEIWAKYKDAVARLEAEQNTKRNNLWLLRGIDVKVPDDGWDTIQKELFGIDVPTDPIERKLHYITTEILITIEDYFNAIRGITALSMAGLVSKEVLDARLESFRDYVQQSAFEKSQHEKESVATQLELTGDSHSEGMGIDTESVQKPT